jgi:hypothetical protein
MVIGGFAPSLLNFRGPLFRDLVARGYRVTAVAPADDSAAGVAEGLAAIGVAFQGVTMARSGMNPLQDLQFYLDLVRLFRAQKPDVVLAYTAKPVIYGGMAARKVGGIRFHAMITGLGYAFTDGGGLRRKPFRALMGRLYRRGLSAASAVIFQNPDDHALFRDLKLLRKSTPTVQVNGSGVDLTAFPPQPLPEVPIFLMLLER